MDTNENTGFEVYKLYNALRLHFTTDSYDFFKYGGKSNVSKDSFLNNKTKYSFYRISRKYSLEEVKFFFVANFISRNDTKWIGEFTGEEADKTYKDWLKRKQSLTYHFKEELDKLYDKFDNPNDIFRCNNRHFPELLNYLISGGSLEVVIMLNRLLNFLPSWNKLIADDIVWPIWRRKIEKYTPFLEFDEYKIKSIIIAKMRESKQIA